MPVTFAQVKNVYDEMHHDIHELSNAVNSYGASKYGGLDEAQPGSPTRQLTSVIAKNGLEVQLIGKVFAKLEKLEQTVRELNRYKNNPEGVTPEVEFILSTIDPQGELDKVKSSLDGLKAREEQLTSDLKGLFNELVTDLNTTHAKCEESRFKLMGAMEEFTNNVPAFYNAADSSRPDYTPLAAFQASQTVTSQVQHLIGIYENQLNLLTLRNEQKSAISELGPDVVAEVSRNIPDVDISGEVALLNQLKEAKQVFDAEYVRLESQVAAGTPRRSHSPSNSASNSASNTPAAARAADVAPAVQAPVLQTATPVARPTFSDRFSRLSITKKVLLGTALAVPAVAGLCVLSGLIAARMVVSIPVSWPMLIRRLAGHQYTPNEILQHRGLSTLLGHSVVEALTDPSKKSAAYVLLTQAITVAAAAATAGVGIGSFAVWYTAVIISEVGAMLTITPELNSVLEKVDGMNMRDILPTTVSPAPHIPANFRVQ